MQAKTEMVVPFIDLRSQYDAYRKEIDDAIAGVIESVRFVQGPEVDGLEHELASYVGVEECVSCGSGTDALFIALRALGVGPGDEVIVPGFTFFATASMVSLVGATPVFVDVDEQTLTMDPNRLAAAITKKSAAVIPVGLYGQPAAMHEINHVAHKAGLPVIEDAAQSLGATHHDQMSGGLGTVGCTSFYPAKPLGCFGEGGALFTDDADLGASMRQIMNQGQRGGYDHAQIGINGRLESLQAAVLRVKLSHFADELEERAKVARRYDDALSNICEIRPPEVAANNTSVYAQYTIRAGDRDSLRTHLAERGVPTAVHYPAPIYRQEAYSWLGSDWVRATAESCPHCEHAAREVLSLPFGPFLSSHDQDLVIEAIRSWKGRAL